MFIVSTLTPQVNVPDMQNTCRLTVFLVTWTSMKLSSMGCKPMGRAF